MPVPASTSPASTSRNRHRDPLAVLAHLTDRDRRILDLLDQHQALTGGQLLRVFFTAERTCQIRLNTLREMGLLDRFRFASSRGGSLPWKWALGLAGARLQAATAGRPEPTERAHRERVVRLAYSPTLNHLLTGNEFFVRLHHAARTVPGTGLDRWWSERVCMTAFGGVRPDGHGLWTAGGRTVGLFLECDLGSEDLPRLVAKLPGYARLAISGGPRYPVLFWLPSRQRELNLQRLLHLDPPPVPVATATHDADPAGPVWLPATSWRRVPLTSLPSDHGPDSAINPNWRSGHLDLTAGPPPQPPR